MEEGDIILTVFPQDAEQKLRPSLMLRLFPKYGDVLVCGITSKLNQYIPDFDLLLDKGHSDYVKSGLKVPGVCRLNMLTMIPKSFIKGRLGSLSSATHEELLKRLADYLVKE